MLGGGGISIRYFGGWPVLSSINISRSEWHNIVCAEKSTTLLMSNWSSYYLQEMPYNVFVLFSISTFSPHGRWYPSNLNVKLNNVTAECVNEAKCLGVTQDSHLTFNSHVNSIATVVKQKNRSFKKVKKSFWLETIIVVILGVCPSSHSLLCQCMVWEE